MRGVPALNVRLRVLASSFEKCNPASWRREANWGEIIAAGGAFVKQDYISQAITHEGKLYNFDFDFFRADRLVCTEVVYRAFDGIGQMEFVLKQRAGRLTLSAEDLLDMAVDNRGFEPVAVFGAEGASQAVTTGSEAAEFLSASYR